MICRDARSERNALGLDGIVADAVERVCEPKNDGAASLRAIFPAGMSWCRVKAITWDDFTGRVCWVAPGDSNICIVDLIKRLQRSM